MSAYHGRQIALLTYCISLFSQHNLVFPRLQGTNDALVGNAIGFTKLMQYLAPNTRPFAFHKLVEHLNHRKLLDLQSSSDPELDRLRNLTVMDHIKTLLRGVGNARSEHFESLLV